MLYWLRGRSKDTNFFTLNLAVSLCNIAHGEHVITLDPNRIEKYIHIPDAAVARLTKQFCLPRNLEPVRTRTKLDYPTLARSYKELIDKGYFRNQAHLAGYLGVSRAWISKVLHWKERTHTSVSHQQDQE